MQYHLSMLVLLAKLFPILLVDIANPVLFALMVFAAGTKRPVLNSSSLLIGHTLAYFVAGIVIALGLEQISDVLENPKRIDFALGGVIGALLIWVFFSMRGGKKPVADEPEWELTPLKCLALGAIANFIGIPFALPYFGAVDQILLADLALANSLFALAIYNFGYAMLFAVVPVSVALFGGRARPFLERINRFLEKASDLILPWLILLLGLWLVFDALRYFLLEQT